MVCLQGRVAEPAPDVVVSGSQATADGRGRFFLFGAEKILLHRASMRFHARRLEGLGHEVDHLDGVLFIDRLDEHERQRVADELRDMAGGMIG
jgi:deoxyribodipyrimidine photolyase-like uncharacterized protein